MQMNKRREKYLENYWRKNLLEGLSVCTFWPLDVSSVVLIGNSRKSALNIYRLQLFAFFLAEQNKQNVNIFVVVVFISLNQSRMHNCAFCKFPVHHRPLNLYTCLTQNAKVALKMLFYMLKDQMMSRGSPAFLLTLPGVRKRAVIMKAVLETIHWSHRLNVES